MPTTTRLLGLLSLLQTRRDWPGATLAERLEVSPRTVRRDVDRLREMGYRITATHGPAGGYRLDAGSELPPLLFDEDQAVALAVALQAAPLVGAGVDEASLRALTTVRQVLPSRLRHRVDAVQFTALAGVGTAPVDPATLAAVSDAIASQEQLRFDYLREGTEDAAAGPPRRAEPHHLVATRGRWYLVAWDLDRDDWRVFRVDRIQPRSHRGARFSPRQLPGGDVHRFVSARFKGSADADAWACRGKVVLQLPAHRVLPFAGDGTVEALSADRCSLELGAWSWVALAALLARFDAEIEVVQPPELAAAFGVLAERMQRAAVTPRG